ERLPASPQQAVPGPTLTVRLLRILLAPVALVITLAATDPAKRKSIVLHWTRPARLAWRAFVARAVYVSRSLRRTPARAMRVGAALVRRAVVRPWRWARHRGKMALHAVLTWRKGEPDRVG